MSITNDFDIVKCDCVTKTPVFSHHKKTCPHRLSEENKLLKAQLKKYADGDHMVGDFDDWDSASGEPTNVLWHEELPFGVESGSCARIALDKCEQEF